MVEFMWKDADGKFVGRYHVELTVPSLSVAIYQAVERFDTSTRNACARFNKQQVIHQARKMVVIFAKDGTANGIPHAAWLAAPQYIEPELAFPRIQHMVAELTAVVALKESKRKSGNKRRRVQPRRRRGTEVCGWCNEAGHLARDCISKQFQNVSIETPSTEQTRGEARPQPEELITGQNETTGHLLELAGEDRGRPWGSGDWKVSLDATTLCTGWPVMRYPSP
uniref:WGS project CBMI000000000 data, contig CS3069_c002980 n=1 Tax=Fusarium clavum TaxID=2594811 RepID=A0A090MD86_9HYPO|nr:unnamed protein product [Fusarium clavum]